MKIFMTVKKDKILVMSQETYYVRITLMLYRTTRNSSFADRKNSLNVVGKWNFLMTFGIILGSRHIERRKIFSGYSS